MLPLSALILWQMPAVVGFLSQGYEVGGERHSFAVLFARIMFGYLTLVSLMALCVGILNANRRFAPGPAVQIGYNVILIAALVLLVPAVGYPAHVLSVGVLSAGVFQFALAWVLASLLVGITVIPRLPRFDARLRSMLLLMGPGILSASGLQIASLMNRALASDTIGAQAQLYYAERLYFLPLAMIGIAFGVVILPTLTRALTQGDTTKAQATIHAGLELAAFIALPASVALAVMPREVLSTLFQYGAFDSRATVQAGWILLALALGLTPVVFQRILYPAFYARKDTMTPMLLTFLGCRGASRSGGDAVPADRRAGFGLVCRFGGVGTGGGCGVDDHAARLLAARRGAAGQTRPLCAGRRGDGRGALCREIAFAALFRRRKCMGKNSKHGGTCGGGRPCLHINQRCYECSSALCDGCVAKVPQAPGLTPSV